MSNVNYQVKTTRSLLRREDSIEKLKEERIIFSYDEALDYAKETAPELNSILLIINTDPYQCKGEETFYYQKRRIDERIERARREGLYKKDPRKGVSILERKLTVLCERQSKKSKDGLVYRRGGVGAAISPSRIEFSNYPILEINIDPAAPIPKKISRKEVPDSKINGVVLLYTDGEEKEKSHMRTARYCTINNYKKQNKKVT